MGDFHLWDDDKRITDVADLTDDMLLAVALDPDGMPSLKAAALSLIKTKLAVPVKATGAEVDTGTDDELYVTPKAIADSSIGDVSIISKTVAEMQALVGSFVQGQLYLITDANKTDLGVLIRAATADSLENAGSGGFLNADFQKVGDYSGVVGFAANQGVWTAALDATVVDNDVVIWNCLHYLVADASSVDGTDPATNAVAYSLLSKVAGHGYIAEWDAVLYDLANNWLAGRFDKLNNSVSQSFYADYYQAIESFQWGNEQVSDNLVSGGSLFKCLNNVGALQRNVLLAGSFIDLSQNAGTVTYVEVTNGSEIHAINNTGTIQRLVLLGNSRLNADLNAGMLQNLEVGQTYLLTANLGIGETLENAVFPQISKLPSANVRSSHDVEAVHTSDTDYTKVKTITLSTGLFGSARFLFDLKTSNVLNTANGQIYRNGVALGAEQSDVTGVYATKSEDITQDWNPGDTVELWVKIDDAAQTVSVQNFRICYDDNIAVPSVNS